MKNEKLTPGDKPSYSNSSMESGKDKEKPRKETQEQKEKREAREREKARKEAEERKETQEGRKNPASKEPTEDQEEQNIREVEEALGMLEEILGAGAEPKDTEKIAHELREKGYFDEGKSEEELAQIWDETMGNKASSKEDRPEEEPRAIEEPGSKAAREKDRRLRILKRNAESNAQSEVNRAIKEAQKTQLPATDQLHRISINGFDHMTAETMQSEGNYPGKTIDKVRSYLNFAKNSLLISEEKAEELEKQMQQVEEEHRQATRRAREARQGYLSDFGLDRTKEDPDQDIRSWEVMYEEYNNQITEGQSEEIIKQIANELKGRFKDSPDEYLREMLEEIESGEVFQDEDRLEFMLKRFDKYREDAIFYGSLKKQEDISSINEYTKTLNELKENLSSLSDDEKKEAASIAKKTIEKLRGHYHGAEFKELDDREIRSLEDLARLIMAQESEDWRTGGEKELITKEGELKINNFYAYVKSRLLYFDDLTPDAPIQLFSEVQFPTTYRNITLGEILNVPKYARKRVRKLSAVRQNEIEMLDRNGNVIYTLEDDYVKDNAYQNLIDSLKVEIWMYNRDHDFDAMYRLVAGQREELKKQLGEILYGNVMTQSKDRLLRFLRLAGSTEDEIEEGGALYDILTNSSFEQSVQGRVGKIIRRTILAYFHISDERMVEKIFERDGMDAFYEAIINDFGGIDDTDDSKDNWKGYDKESGRFVLGGRMKDVAEKHISEKDALKKFTEQYEAELNDIKTRSADIEAKGDDATEDERRRLLEDKRKLAIKMGIFLFPEDKKWAEIFKKPNPEIADWEEREKKENYIWRDWGEVEVDTLIQNELYLKDERTQKEKKKSMEDVEDISSIAGFVFREDKDGSHILRDHNGFEVVRDKATGQILQRNEDGDLMIQGMLLKDAIRDKESEKIVRKKKKKNKDTPPEIESIDIETEIIRGQFERVSSKDLKAGKWDYTYEGDLGGDYEMLFNPFNSHIKDLALVTAIRKGIRNASQTLEQDAFEKRKEEEAKRNALEAAVHAVTVVKDQTIQLSEQKRQELDAIETSSDRVNKLVNEEIINDQQAEHINDFLKSRGTEKLKKSALDTILKFLSDHDLKHVSLTAEQAHRLSVIKGADERLAYLKDQNLLGKRVDKLEEHIDSEGKRAKGIAERQTLLKDEDVFYGENFVWRMTSWTGIAANQETKARCVDKLGNLFHMGQYLFGRQIKGRGQYGLEDYLPGIHKLANTYWEAILVKEEGDTDPTTPLLHVLQGGDGDEVNIDDADVDNHNIKDFEFKGGSERQYLIDSIYEAFSLFNILRNQKGLNFMQFISRDPLTGELRIDHEKADEAFYTLWHNVRYAYDNSGYEYAKTLRGGLSTITREHSLGNRGSEFVRHRVYRTQNMKDRMLDREPQQMNISDSKVAKKVLAYLISKELGWHRKVQAGQERWDYEHYQLIKQYLTQSLPLDAKEVRDKDGVRRVIFTKTFFNEDDFEKEIAGRAGVSSSKMFRARLALDLGAGAALGVWDSIKRFFSSLFE